MEMVDHDERPTTPISPSSATPAMIVVADDACERLAIQRSFPRCAFYFASTVEEAEALARTGLATSFYVF